MRKGSPHPLFIVCVVIAIFAALGSVVLAVKASQCKPAAATASKDCSAGNQIQDDTALVLAVSGVGLAIAALGFQVGQIGQANTPAPPPRAPLPPPAAPPYPGPPPNQG